jgi:hypothetical protein
MKGLSVLPALLLFLVLCSSGLADDCDNYDDKRSCKKDTACKWNPKKNHCEPATQTQVTAPPGPWDPKVEKAPSPCAMLTGQGYCENDTEDNCYWNYKRARCQAKPPDKKP